MVSIRNYKAGDERGIMQLFELVFKKKISLDFWNWRFKNNVLSETPISLIYENEKLLSHYAVSPFALLINNKPCKAALSMTTMTHPEYNGRGYFKQTANHLYSHLQNENYHVVYGFPNANSHYAFVNSLDWKNIERIPTLVLNNFSTVENKIVFNKISCFNENHYQIFLKETSKYSVKINRNANYLNWRYVKNPLNVYDCYEAENTFFVLKIFEINGAIQIDLCELYCPDKIEILNSIFCFIYNNYKNISQINFWLPQDDSKHLLLEKIGFKLSAPITYFGYRNISNDNPEIKNTDWFYSLGDSDIY